MLSLDGCHLALEADGAPGRLRERRLQRCSAFPLLHVRLAARAHPEALCVGGLHQLVPAACTTAHGCHH